MLGLTILLILIVVGVSLFIVVLLRMDTNIEISPDQVDPDTGELLVSPSQ